MTHPEKIVERYKHVIALAQRGSTDGERTAAQNAAASMREKYPNIHAQAFPPSHSSSPPPAGTPFTQGGTNDGSMPWYERFTGFREQAREAFDWASRVAAEMASLEYARSAADELVEMQTKTLAKERVQIAIKLPLREVFYLGARFNEAQKQEFASRIAGLVEAEILRLMNEE